MLGELNNVFGLKINILVIQEMKWFDNEIDSHIHKPKVYNKVESVESNISEA